MARSPTAPHHRSQPDTSVGPGNGASSQHAVGPTSRSFITPSRRSLAPESSSSQTTMVHVGAERKKRRVTFSNRQERTDFATDEPTMHIRPPVESEMASVTQSTISTPGSAASKGAEDSLIPRLHGYGSEVDDTESSSEEESSDEEDASAVDMELATVSGPARQWDEDQTMDLTDAIASIEDKGDYQSSEGSDDRLEDDAGYQSTDMEFTQAQGTIIRRRQSSGAASPYSVADEERDDDGSLDMELTGDEASEADAVGDAWDTSATHDGMHSDGSIAKASAVHLRARDSLAVHRAKDREAFGAPNGRQSLDDGQAFDHGGGDFGQQPDESDHSEPMDMTDEDVGANDDIDNEETSQHAENFSSKSSTRQTTPTGDPRKASSPMRARSSMSSSAHAAPLFTSSPPKSPGTSRFRRSLLAGVSESPRSPARRVQVMVDPAETPKPPVPMSRMSISAPWSARKDASEGDGMQSAPVAPSRKSVGGALPSANALRPGKPSTMRPQGPASRSSIVAAVLPQSPGFASRDGVQRHSELAEAGHSAALSSHDIQEAGDEAQEPPRNLTLSEFFSLSGMSFHDDTRPMKVKVVPPRDLKKRDDSHPEKKLQQIKAMAGSVPMLDVLVQACRELKESVSDGSAVLREIEERFVESPPDLVRELLSLSSEAEKKEMESQFKLQKQAARAIAREGYLGWCLDNQYGPELIAQLQSTRAALAAELVRVKTDGQKMQREILPILRARRDTLKAQVQKAHARKSEIERCPVSDLEFLHSGMAEVLPELQSRRAINREKSESLERMRAKLEESLHKKAELEAIIDQARKVCAQIHGYTPAEAARLAAEIRNIERLHLWKIHSASLSKMHLTHDSVFDIMILLGAAGVCESIDVTLTSSASGSVLLEETLEALKEGIAITAEQQGAWSVPRLVRYVSNAWSSCRHLQSEINQLSLRHPTEVVALAGSPRCVLLCSSIVLPRNRSKISLSLRVDLELLLDGESQQQVLHLESQDHAAAFDVVYGSVDATALNAQLTHNLSAGPSQGVLGSGELSSAIHAVIDAITA
ncbi:unnamed protein product [Parajaminaea phylloscopi]